MPTDGSTSPTFEYKVTATSPLCTSPLDIVTDEQGSIACKAPIVCRGWCLLSMLHHREKKVLKTTRTMLWGRGRGRILQRLLPLARPRRLLLFMLLLLLLLLLLQWQL